MLPEGRIPLSVITIELCLFPKSNTAYKSLDKAINDVKKGRKGELPEHLQDTHYRGVKELGAGNDYLYPHDLPDSWVNQDYLLKELKDTVYYEPKEADEGRRLGQIYHKLNSLRGQ